MAAQEVISARALMQFCSETTTLTILQFLSSEQLAGTFYVLLKFGFVVIAPIDAESTVYR